MPALAHPSAFRGSWWQRVACLLESIDRVFEVITRLRKTLYPGHVVHGNQQKAQHGHPETSLRPRDPTLIPHPPHIQGSHAHPAPAPHPTHSHTTPPRASTPHHQPCLRLPVTACSPHLEPHSHQGMDVFAAHKNLLDTHLNCDDDLCTRTCGMLVQLAVAKHTSAHGVPAQR